MVSEHLPVNMSQENLNLPSPILNTTERAVGVGITNRDYNAGTSNDSTHNSDDQDQGLTDNEKNIDDPSEEPSPDMAPAHDHFVAPTLIVDHNAGTKNDSTHISDDQQLTDNEKNIDDPSEKPSPNMAPPLGHLVAPTLVVGSVVPRKGMEFETCDEAYNCYLEYSRKSGFPVVKRNKKKGDDGLDISIMVTCQKGSRPQRLSLHGKPKRRRSICYTGCPARMIVNLNRKSGKWVVTTFKEFHDHDLFPKHSIFMTSHQHLPIGVQKQLENSDHASVPIHNSIDASFAETGGSENCSSTNGNMGCHIENVRCLKFGEGDSKALMNYFDRMQHASPDFFYSCSVDDRGRLMNIFWADSQSRAAFKDFGDVVSFDTTCLTNKYKIPLALFTGCDNHKQSLFYAAVLLADEKEPNYIWAFKKWKDCFGQPPQAIITNQCQAMGKAIEKEFPNTRHRLCLWHIMQKLPIKLGPHAAKDGSLSAVECVIYDSWDIDEFEKGWRDVLKQHKLEQHEWLVDMYQLRSKWVPAYVRGHFWANMSTTQRIESMNDFFDGYFNLKTPLKIFVTKFEQAMKDKRDKQSCEDYFSLANAPDILTTNPYEVQASNVYTRNVFKDFRDEVLALANCSVVSLTNLDAHYTMGVKQIGTSHTYCVAIDVKNCKVKCECRLFEFKGILCAHALCGMRQLDLMVIPDKYVLRRWRKDCRKSHMYVAVSTGPIYRNMGMYNQIFRECYSTMLDLVDVASCNADAENELKKGMKSLLDHITGSKKFNAQAFCASNAAPINQGMKRKPTNLNSQSESSQPQKFNPSRPIEMYARTPVSVSTPRQPALELQNGVMYNFSNESVHSEGPFIPLNPPSSPRSGRPPTIRKNKQNKVDAQRL